MLVPDLPPDERGQVIQTLVTILVYGLAGAFLISRHPDLPFGWLLAGASAALVLCLCTYGPAS